MFGTQALYDYEHFSPPRYKKTKFLSTTSSVRLHWSIAPFPRPLVFYILHLRHCCCSWTPELPLVNHAVSCSNRRRSISFFLFNFSFCFSLKTRFCYFRHRHHHWRWWWWRRPLVAAGRPPVGGASIGSFAAGGGTATLFRDLILDMSLSSSICSAQYLLTFFIGLRGYACVQDTLVSFVPELATNVASYIHLGGYTFCLARRVALFHWTQYSAYTLVKA